MKTKYLLFCTFLLLTSQLFSQNERSMTRKGNRDMESGNYYDAEIKYRKALETSPLMEEGGFNLGNSLYKQDKYEESAQQYLSTGETAENVATKSNSYYNLGNSLYNLQQYDGAVEAYKQALRDNPSDEDARYNLAMAQLKLQQQSGGQGGGGNNDQNQQDNQDKQENQQQQQNQEQQDQNQEQNEQQQNQQQQQNDQQQQEGQEAQPMQISKEDAERMLEALKNNEQKTIKKVQDSKSKGQRVKVDKDW